MDLERGYDGVTHEQKKHGVRQFHTYDTLGIESDLCRNWTDEDQSVERHKKLNRKHLLADNVWKELD